MPFYFTCPYCFKKTLVEDKYAGQTGACACCSKQVTLPFICSHQPHSGISTSQLFQLSQPEVDGSTGQALHISDDGSVGTELMPTAKSGQPSWTRTETARAKRVTTTNQSDKKRIVIAIASVFILLLLCMVTWQVVNQFSSSKIFLEWQKQHDRTISLNNLTRIAAAMNNYASKHNSYPPAVTYDSNGKPMHSWRVLILPELGLVNLYNQYRFDEPWDSETNSKVFASCPDVYQSPLNIGNSAEANYFVLSGNKSLFPLNASFDPKAISDGTGRTLLVVEAANGIHEWTKPVDISTSGTSSLKIGGLDPDGFSAVLADGTPVWIPGDTTTNVIDAMTSPEGGEAVDVTRFVR